MTVAGPPSGWSSDPSRLRARVRVLARIARSVVEMTRKVSSITMVSFGLPPETVRAGGRRVAAGRRGRTGPTGKELENRERPARGTPSGRKSRTVCENVRSLAWVVRGE